MCPVVFIYIIHSNIDCIHLLHIYKQQNFAYQSNVLDSIREVKSNSCGSQTTSNILSKQNRILVLEFHRNIKVNIPL